MFNDPKYKKAVKDISSILEKHNKEYMENILAPVVADRVSVCTEAISKVPLGERTAETIGGIMKDHYYGASRDAQAEVTHEKAGEFYRRVYDSLKQEG